MGRKMPCYFQGGSWDGRTVPLGPLQSFVYGYNRSWWQEYRLDRLEPGRAVYVFVRTL